MKDIRTYIILALIGISIFLYFSGDKKISDIQSRYDAKLDYLMKESIENDKLIKNYYNQAKDIRKQRDSIQKRLEEIIKQKDETPIPNTDPVTNDSALLDSIIHYARK